MCVCGCVWFNRADYQCYRDNDFYRNRRRVYFLMARKIKSRTRSLERFPNQKQFIIYTRTRICVAIYIIHTAPLYTHTSYIVLRLNLYGFRGLCIAEHHMQLYTLKGHYPIEKFEGRKTFSENISFLYLLSDYRILGDMSIHQVINFQVYNSRINHKIGQKF